MVEFSRRLRAIAIGRPGCIAPASAVIKDNNLGVSSKGRPLVLLAHAVPQPSAPAYDTGGQVDRRVAPHRVAWKLPLPTGAGCEGLLVSCMVTLSYWTR